MLEKNLTRRHFAAGGAAAAALALAGGNVVGHCGGLAFAEEDGGTPVTRQIHTVSAASPARPGVIACVANGRVDRVLPETTHPASRGYLSAADYAAMVDGTVCERVEAPLRRTASGEFEAVSWEEALGAIGAELSGVPGAGVAVVAGASPLSRRCATSLALALDSAKVAAVGAGASASLRGGTAQAIGYEAYVPDFESAAMVLMLGTFEGEAPALQAAMAEARDRGCRIVVASSRYAGAALLAGEWLPVKPGTELALVLALSRELWFSGAADEGYVLTQGDGVEEWAASVEGCSLAWAADICGVSAAQIAAVAAGLAEAAPAASVALPVFGADGLGAPAGELARATALLNTLLGCWNHPGGAFVAPIDPFGEVNAAAVFPRAEATKYPLAPASTGSAVAVLEEIAAGEVQALVLFGADGLSGVGSLAGGAAAEALADAPLVIAVTDIVTPAMSLCTYVLPTLSSFEADDLCEVVVARTPAVARGVAVAAPAVAEARPMAQIAQKLAVACGCDEGACVVDEAAIAEAQAASVGLSCAALAGSGALAVPGLGAPAKGAPWPTETGKIRFSSEACAAAGLAASPTWVDLESAPAGSVFLTVGEGLGHAGAVAGGTLANLAERYGLDDIWVNPVDAAAAGIVDGDRIVVANDCASVEGVAVITERIVPGALCLPASLLVTANIAPAAFAPLAVEVGYGGFGARQVTVTLGKAGA